MTNPTVKLFSAGVLAATLVSGAARSATAQTNAAPAPKAADKFAEFFGDTVVAKGKGVEVKSSQMDEHILSYKTAAAASGQPVSPQQLKIIKRRILDALITQQLVLGKATEEDKRKAKVEQDTALRTLKTERKLTDEEFDKKLGEQLRAEQMTREQWNQRRLEQQIYLAVLERELKIAIGDDQLKKFYDEHPTQFEEPERARVSHILIYTKDPADNNQNPALRRDLPDDLKQVKLKKIEDLLKRARAGEDFTKLARENSEDPAVKENNGEYTLARGDSFVPEFKNAAFSLSSNQVSDVITTVFGYHIVKLMEKIPAQKIELAKVSERLRAGLKQQEIGKLLPDYLEKLQKDANVEILDEQLKAVDLDALFPPKVATPPAAEPKK